MINDIYKCVKYINNMAWTKDVNVDIDEEKTSRINAAGIINITLENLWRDSYLAMSKSDLITWNRKLDAIWIILGGDVKKGGEEDKAYLEIEAKIYNTGSLKLNRIGFEYEQNDKRTLQYLLLKEKALFLRRLQNLQGKGTAYESGDDYDFD